MPFPRTQNEINAILQLWKERLPVHAAKFGLSADQIKQIIVDAIVYNHLLTAKSYLNEDVSEFFTYFDNITVGDQNIPASPYPIITLLAMPDFEGEIKPGIVIRNTELYNFFKKHPNRTAEVLADLGISESSGSSISPDLLKPAINGGAMPDDKVSLTFNKQGQSAVRFQMRRGGEWITVGDPTSNPFIDTTASVDGKPEKREYRAIYLVKNQPIGQYSDIITIYTTP
ncbi:MAG TPA: hypothetical protein PKE69_25175 [Pyrinomonadaceae bacterium]|nr:hypothetical protein [Pyrinomonadaceae bacterium]